MHDKIHYKLKKKKKEKKIYYGFEKKNKRTQRIIKKKDIELFKVLISLLVK